MTRDLHTLQQKKLHHEAIVALTCYDYPTAMLEEQAGIDLLFVGDSVGTNILGYDNETQVTLADILHHLKAVRRGAPQTCILADLPYATYDTPDEALSNAQQLVAHGADIVKFEGAHLDIAKLLVAAGIPVCGHLGLQPQTQAKKAFQGKQFDQAKALIEQSLQLEAAGISLLVLELVTEELAQIIADRLNIPTIGIGSGRYTDGQVLIVNDILGITPRKLKLAKQYADYRHSTLDIVQQYQADVRSRHFPTAEHTRSMPAAELAQVQQWLASPAAP